MADIISASLDKHAEQVMDYNKQQLDKGLDSKGKSLGEYRNFAYKKRFKPVDLKLTGSFRDKFTINRSKGKKQSEIFSQDEKQDDLVKRFGPDIQGLSFANLKNTGELIRPDVQRYFLLSLLANGTKVVSTKEPVSKPKSSTGTKPVSSNTKT